MDFKKGRDAYSYPLVGLTGTVSDYHHATFPSSRALEEHHARLLGSNMEDEVLLGYLSTLYWGHFSGANGKTNAGRARARVRMALYGQTRNRKGQLSRSRGVRDIGRTHAVSVIRKAKELIDSQQFGKAVQALCTLPQLGFAFASKIIAFLAPARCAVIDSVIVKKYPNYGFHLQGKYVSQVRENFKRYQDYCVSLRTLAQIQNAAEDESAHWQDKDGVLYPWRAVDIERAMYAL